MEETTVMFIDMVNFTEPLKSDFQTELPIYD